MLTITKQSDDQFEVRVKTKIATTNHTVTVSEDYLVKLTNGNATPEELLEASFNFLLERESNQQILKAFDLSLIQEYFPEYEDAMKTKFSTN